MPRAGVDVVRWDRIEGYRSPTVHGGEPVSGKLLVVKIEPDFDERRPTAIFPMPLAWQGKADRPAGHRPEAPDLDPLASELGSEVSQPKHRSFFPSRDRNLSVGFYVDSTKRA